MNKILLILFSTLVISVSPLWADGGSSNSNSYDVAAVPDKVVRLVEAEQFDRAVVELEQFVKQEKKNPDAWNWLGYSQRKSGDLDGSLKSYKKALKLDKKHLGANEYLGELYIMRGEMKNARKQLKRLAKYCGDCEEHKKLEEAIQNAGG